MLYEIELPQDLTPQPLAELLEHELFLPRKVRHFLRMRKGVALNGVPKNFAETAHPGDRLTLTLADSDYPQPQVLSDDFQMLQVLYEDPWLLIVNKPAGIKVHPNEPHERGTLLNQIAGYLQKTGQMPYVVHRLDQATSGAILFAKDPVILPILDRLLREKAIRRVYQAEAWGKFPQSEMTIDRAIGRDRHDPKKRCVTAKGGKKAVTHLTVLQFANGKSRLHVTLSTGRTHQIRVHLAALGHPLVNDPLYGKKTPQGRLMLHSYQLSLRHPYTHQTISVTAEPGIF